MLLLLHLLVLTCWGGRLPSDDGAACVIRSHRLSWYQGYDKHLKKSTPTHIKKMTKMMAVVGPRPFAALTCLHFISAPPYNRSLITLFLHTTKSTIKHTEPCRRCTGCTTPMSTARQRSC